MERKEDIGAIGGFHLPSLPPSGLRKLIFWDAFERDKQDFLDHQEDAQEPSQNPLVVNQYLEETPGQPWDVLKKSQRFVPGVGGQ